MLSPHFHISRLGVIAVTLGWLSLADLVAADIVVPAVYGNASDLSEACPSILTTAINCDASLAWATDINMFYTSDVLGTLCTSTCATALDEWLGRVKAVCGTSRYSSGDGYSYLASYGVELALERYKVICLQNSLHAAFFQPNTITKSNGFGERFEVVGMSNSASDPQQPQTLAQKARMCADYDDQERAARMATGSDEFYIPLQLSNAMYRRALVMIDRLNPETADWDTRVLDSWQDPRVKEFEYMALEDSPCGSFSVVWWQPRMRGWEEDGEGVPPPDHLHLRTFPLEMFTLMLRSGMNIRVGLNTFYEHFVADGRMDEELRRAREQATGHG